MHHLPEHVARAADDRASSTRARRTPSTVPVSNAAVARAVKRRDALRRTANGDGAGPLEPEVGAAIDSQRGRGNVLPRPVQDEMGRAFGADFSGVRVHTDDSADQLSRSVNAEAFTTGQDIFFSAGSFDPGSRSGQELIAHELTHVVQNSPGASGGPSVVSHPDDKAEVEARATAALVVASLGQPVAMPTAARTSPSGAVLREDDPPQSDIDRLNEMLDAFNTPEDEAIALIQGMSGGDKATVAAGYRDRLASAMNFAEMKQVVQALPLTLPDKLRWLQAAALADALIDYSEIQDLVTAAPQGDRDACKTADMMAFFVSVCTNETMLLAVSDMGFDLQTKLTWLQAEVFSTSAEIDYSMIKPWIVAAPQGDKDALKGGWLPFFIQVCTNVTMIEALNDLGYDLITKLTWLNAETIFGGFELSYSDIQPWIVAGTQADRDSLNPSWKPFFIQVCTNDTMAQAVMDLGYPLPEKLRWMIDEGCDYDHLKTVITGSADKAVGLADQVLLFQLYAELSWDDFAKCVELLGRTIPGTGAIIADGNYQAAIAAAWGDSNVAVTRAPPEPPTPGVHEEGGFVYFNLIDNTMSTSRVAAGGQAMLPLEGPAAPDYSITIAGFHTHPNIGPDWGSPFFSDADEAWSARKGVPILMRGAFPDVATISDHATGTDRQHLAGDRGFPGASGGTAPQRPRVSESMPG